MSRSVQVTVLHDQDGRTRISSKTLKFDDDARPDRMARIAGDQARLCAEIAITGRLLPTSTKEGGRG